MLVSDDAFILHSRKFGDSSRIISAYTREHGKLSFMAKGAYKPKSKFGTSVEPLNISRINFYKKPNRELHLLSSSEILVNLHKLHADLDKMAYSFMIAETIEQTEEKESPNEELFELISKSIQLIDLHENCFSIFVHTILNFTRISGFAIELNRRSEKSADGNYFYSFSNGEITIERPDFGRYYFLSADILNLFHKLLSVEADKSPEINSDKVSKRKIINFFIEYLSYHIEKRFHFKSQKLLMV